MATSSPPARVDLPDAPRWGRPPRPGGPPVGLVRDHRRARGDPLPLVPRRRDRPEWLGLAGPGAPLGPRPRSPVPVPEIGASSRSAGQSNRAGGPAGAGTDLAATGRCADRGPFRGRRGPGARRRGLTGTGGDHSGRMARQADAADRSVRAGRGERPDPGGARARGPGRIGRGRPLGPPSTGTPARLDDLGQARLDARRRRRLAGRRRGLRPVGSRGGDRHRSRSPGTRRTACDGDRLALGQARRGRLGGSR